MWILRVYRDVTDEWIALATYDHESDAKRAEQYLEEAGISRVLVVEKQDETDDKDELKNVPKNPNKMQVRFQYKRTI